MDILTKRELQELITFSAERCLSIYMPTHRLGRQQQQDPIRFRNMLSNAWKELSESGLRHPDVEKFLSPLDRYNADRFFWQHQSDGLAIFISPGTTHIYRLPFQFDEMLMLSKNFYVKPLVPLLSRNEKFYILAISINNVGLFFATRETVDPIELGEIPGSLKEALIMDDPEKHLGYHTSASSPGRHGMRRAVFHGHGGKPGAQKTNLLRYFHHVNRRLDEVLDEKKIPMVLAGVDYLLPIYHQTNTYQHLMDEGLEGNPEALEMQELHRSAWELVEPVFRSEEESALKKVIQLHGQESPQAAAGLEAVLSAAHAGQVETLFLAAGMKQWGKFDPLQQKVLLTERQEPGSEELLDLSITWTLLNSGKVYVVDPQKLPPEGVVAILRYGP